MAMKLARGADQNARRALAHPLKHRNHVAIAKRSSGRLLIGFESGFFSNQSQSITVLISVC